MKNFTFSKFKKYSLKEWKERNLISDEIIFTSENSKKSFQTIFKEETKAYEWIDNKKPELTNQRIIDCIDLNFNNIWIENVSAPEIIFKDIKCEKTNFLFFKTSENSREAISSFCSKKNINYEFVEENSIINFENYDNHALQKFINEKRDKKKLFLFVKSENKFFDQIATLKSLNLNLKNSKKVQIICTIEDSLIKTEDFLYTASFKILSSFLACSDFMIKTIDLNERSRLVKNIYNILKYESNIEKVSDPLNGSFYLNSLIEKKVNNNFEEKKNLKLPERKSWISDENIEIYDYFIKNDISSLEHINFLSGEPPFLRGPYATMYTNKPWTIRQYSGFSTARDSNAFYKKNISHGQTGLSVAFDLPTHRGYDSDNERVKGDVGMAGVAIDTIDDINELFEGIDLNNISVSMTMNGAVLPIMAFYIACAKENGVDIKNLKGTIQNDILKEFMVRNTYIFPPKPSMRIISDIFKYVSKEMPKFNCISVSGYHMQEAGASAEIELAYTLLNGLEYLRTGIEAGLKIDDFAPRISFFWGIGMNFFTEIAKMRAGRLLWAKIVKSFNPKNPKSMSLRAHCQTSGWSLTEQDPYNNICRTAIEALGAVLGGTQSLHTNSLDEAIALPTEFSAKIARDTQKYLQINTGICDVVDPLGGSYYIEYLTDKIYKKSWEIIEDIEKNGGMIDAISSGIPKTKIEKVATIKQAKIDSGKEIIVGLNKFEKNLKKNKFHLLEIDNRNVIKTQTKKLIKNKKIRNESDVSKILKQITSSCKSKKQNLLTLAVEAAEKRATLAEIIGACEKVFKRYTATNNLISGFYMKEIKDNHHFKKAKNLSDYFYEIEGRRARILVAKMGQDGHDRGAKIVATSFSDMGFDVDIGALFQTPEEVVNQALINDVHIIGISSLAAGHTTNVPEIIRLLKKYNREDILIVLGGVVPENQHKKLIDAGVDLIFGPGSIIAESACNILSKLIDVNESRS
tara:strand:+ start:5808 stop:8723 length:2916 start_codon:yes stop_codon:yes gene_type:complete